MKLVLCIAVFISCGSAFAGDSYVRGYTRSNGAYVQGYHRTTPDNTVNNNYGTYGNANPYTGNSGYGHRNVNQPQGAYNSGNGAGTYSGYGSQSDNEE